MTNTTIIIDSHERAEGCCNPNLAPRINPEAAKQLSDDLCILDHPIRLQILDMLAQHNGEVCVCDLKAARPVKQPTVLHHLKLCCAPSV